MDTKLEKLVTRPDSIGGDLASNLCAYTAAATKVGKLLSIGIRHLEEVSDHSEKTAEHALVKYNPVLSPIRNLPIELLNEIFIHCASMSEQLVEFLRNAMLVSRYWKSALLSFPQLWTTIDINPIIMLSAQKHQSFIQACLINSKNLPLSVTISEASWNAMDLFSCSQYCVALAPHINRFQSFSAPVYFINALIRHCESDIQFLFLRRLHVEGGQAKLSIQAPSLFDLSLVNINAAIYDHDNSIPWNQIASLKLDHCSSDTARMVLENTPNLVSLKLGTSWVVGYSSNLITTEHITLTNLEDLELLHSTPAGPILGMLTAPQLKSMALYGRSPYESVTQFSEAVVSFLRRSPHSVTSFALNYYDPAMLTILLPELHSVKHLHLGFVNSLKGSFEDMIPFLLSRLRGSGENTPPQLRKLTMSASGVKGQEMLLRKILKSWNFNVEVEFG